MKRCLAAASTLLTLCPALVAAPAPPAGPAWAPIPAEVWAMKEATLPEGLGAINLARRLRVTNDLVQNEYRIRICSERGRKAAEFTAFSAAVVNFQGRVVYPDGRELAFDSQKDFHSSLRASLLDREVQERVLVPPGLTDDCVVDLRWDEPRFWLYWARTGRGSETWDLAGPFPTRILTLEIGRGNYFQYFLQDFGLATQPISTPDFSVITLKDVPAAVAVPYTLWVTRNIPRLKTYVQSRELMSAAHTGKDAYWAQVMKLYKDFLTGDLKTGGTYPAFSAALRKDLPAGPQALAQELALRLQDKVLNLDRLSLEEQRHRSRKDDEERIETRDLAALARRGTAHATGIVVLFMQLLREAGVTPKVMLVSDRERGLFNADQRNLNQLDDFLVGIEESGKPAIWLDPSLRFAPPTLILPQYQSTPALEIDTAAWTWKAVTLAPQPPAMNQRRDTYRLELLPDHDRFTMVADFEGYDGYRRKRNFMDLEPREQDRKLREQMETRLETIVDRAEVVGATDPRRPIQWKAEGRIDRASGRLRIVDPFPFTPEALDVPDNLSETRHELIVLPYLFERDAVSRFKLPAGYDWKGLPPYARSNGFGSVTLTAERADGPDGPEGVATLHVKVAQGVAGPGHWADFKAFLGWIQEAASTRLILERKP